MNIYYKFGKDEQIRNYFWSLLGKRIKSSNNSWSISLSSVWLKHVVSCHGLF